MHRSFENPMFDVRVPEPRVIKVPEKKEEQKVAKKDDSETPTFGKLISVVEESKEATPVLETVDKVEEAPSAQESSSSAQTEMKSEDILVPPTEPSDMESPPLGGEEEDDQEQDPDVLVPLS